MTTTTTITTKRVRIHLQGIVQGVGFRPFVYGQALSLGLGGFVLNDSRGVTIEIEGSPFVVEAFRVALASNAPPLARIDSVEVEEMPPRGETTFTIAHSQAGAE